MKKHFAFILLLCALPVMLQAARKKFIAHSWDLLQVPADVIVNNLPELEKLPLDGISIRCYAKDDSGKTVPFTSAMTSGKWKKEWCSYMLPDLKKICGGKLKDNFLSSFWAPHHRLDWQDDAAWENAAHNMGVVAWLAKECGARGLLIDPEDYPRSAQYTYKPGVDKLNYKETCALARKRGAQMMSAIAAEYPDAVLLAFWFFSAHMNLAAQQCDNPRDIMEEAGMLGIDFLNGMLDAIPPKMIMVDATETGYWDSAETYDFYRAAIQITKNFIDVIAPENHVKYRSQYQVGFGLYLDMYTNDKGSTWYFPPKDNSRLARMVDNFTQAMEAADEYCWIYGEQCNWIDWNFGTFKGKVRPTWESKLPGFWKAIALITQKEQTLARTFAKMSQNGTLKNLIANSAAMPPPKKNGDNTPYPPFKHKTLPSNWTFWQLKPEGQFGYDTTLGYDDTYSARLMDMKGGCLLVRTAVTGMQHYAVEAFAKGNGAPVVRVRWQNKNGWFRPEKDVFFSFTEPAKNGWNRAFGCVTVPDGATTMVLLLCASPANGKSCNFDSPAVYHLPLQ